MRMRHYMALCFTLVLAAATGFPEEQHTSPAGRDRAYLLSALGAAPQDSLGTKCGFPLIAWIRSRNVHLSPAARTILQGVLQRSERQAQKSSAHFTVHYDTTGPDAAALLNAQKQPIAGSAHAFADSVLATADHVYDVEVGTLGYDPPPSDGTEGGGPQYDIYVLDLGREYGETVDEVPLDTKIDGGRYSSFISIDNDFSFVSPDSNRGLPALRVTLAHEFHHAIQIGQYGFWRDQRYFYELTSTWMETTVYPEVTDYQNYIRSSSGHFWNPTVSFTSNRDVLMYSRFIWATFLARRYSQDLLREVWTEIRQTDPLTSNDVALLRHGSSFRAAFAEWTLWNYFTGSRSLPDRYYEHGSLYPPIVTNPIEFPAGAQEHRVDDALQPLSARYYELTGTGDTTCIVAANVNSRQALDPAVTADPYALVLSSSKEDDRFEPLTGTAFYKLEAADPGNWKTWVATHGLAVVSGIREGTPFPNPFRTDGTSLVYFPADAASGTVRIYDADMQLVFEARQQPSQLLGKTVFSWDGRTQTHALASTGIYLYTIDTPGGAVIGKFALLRK